ncbi:MAG: SDR family oxidoreductase [Acidobacteriota bacterium]
MGTIFFTGFPGFLGASLLPRVVARDPEAKAVCLIQAKFADLAAEKVAEIEAVDEALAGRIELIEGDITRSDLGLDKATLKRLAGEVREIYHLAAVYDLSVRREVGMRVNVDGTLYVLDFAEGCSGLERLHYVSTCYVSGRYAGIYSERNLDKGQKFNNFYEETKFLAEVEVQERMAGGLPATVYRPAIVVGDSRTGETQKFDGPYYAMRWVMRQPWLAVLPVVGDPNRTRVNLVPRDFIIDAITELSGLEASAGKVYQLADPEPLTVDELLDEVALATRRKLVRLPLPLFAAKAAIDYAPLVGRILQIPSSSVDYFVHPTHYTSTQTRADLADSGIAVPPLPTYLSRLVDYMRRHPEVGSDAMV